MAHRASRKLLAGARRFGIRRTAAGLVRLARLRDGPPRLCAVTTARDGLKLSFERPAQMISTLVVFRELVEPEYELVRRLLGPQSLFVDVGGGIGTYAVVAARLSGARVHVFEPVPRNRATLDVNLRDNRVDGLVAVHDEAISDHEGRARVRAGANLFLTRLDPAANFDGLEVAITTLAGFAAEAEINEVDVLKVDVEGHEPEVLRGAEPLLAAGKIAVLVLERNLQSEPAYQHLGELDYRFYRYDAERNVLTPEPWPAANEHLGPFECNVVAVHRRALPRVGEFVGVAS